MKLFTILLFLGLLSFLYPQSMQIERAIANPVSNFDWANDVVVSAFHPLGPVSGVQKSDGTLYVAVNDTEATSNLGIIIYTSTNKGTTWSMYPSGINYRDQVQNLKMVITPQDSLYIFFNNYTVISCWSVFSGVLYQFTNYPAGYRDFDVVSSSTGNIYMIVDLLANNDLRMFGTSNGGATWTYSNYLTSTGTRPKFSMSATGDTILINYMGVSIQADTPTTAIRSVRYRESGTATLSLVGAFTTPIVADGSQRKEFRPASGNGEAWIVYTMGSDGARIIYGMKSTDKGVTFGTPEVISISTGTDNYYFDVRYLNDIGNGSPGFALIYYSDSLQTGVPTNTSDKLLFCTAPVGGTFGTPFQISDVPPASSTRMYIPKIIPMTVPVTDIGALWVGENNSLRKLYWDRLLATVPVELTSFNASVTAKDVRLTWSTATETNNKGFILERNILGTWEEAAFIKGAGTSVINNNYSYTDIIPGVNNSVIKYRLKQIDLNGTFTYSNVVEANLSLSGFALEQNYPNPFNPSTRINYSLPEKSIVSIKVYDVLGKLIKELVNTEQESGKYSVEFNGSNLSSGMYIYVLKAGAHTITRSMMLIK